MVEKSTPIEVNEEADSQKQDNKAQELTSVDQTKQNVPIDPDVADMLDLLEQKMKQLQLTES